MTLHFAYGSNMHRAVMKKHAPGAEPLGPAALANFRFVVTGDGYASVEPKAAHTVHGVVWRLCPRDRVTLDAWENVASGLYRAETLPVRWNASRYRVLVYRARRRGVGRPKAGYMELVIEAARAWQFPPTYVAALQEWLPPSPLGAAAGPRKLQEFRWT